MQPMTNNLDAMISQSGLSKKEVAALKGVTPETLSRQIHGKIQMTLSDAERYAKILSCSPMDVIVPWTPIPIIGACRMESKNGSEWVQSWRRPKVGQNSTKSHSKLSEKVDQQ